MKHAVTITTIFVASLAASTASAGVPAWCGAGTFNANSSELRTLDTSKDVEAIIPALASALCTPSAEMEAHRSELEQARQAWGKKLGMSDADWADVPVWTRANLGNFFVGDVSTKDLAALTPIDQYAGIYQHFGDLYSKPADHLYAADMLDQHMTETGRMAFIDWCLDDENVARDDGSVAKWAVCWPDIEKFDLAKIYAEISADKAHDGASKMWLRFHAHALVHMIAKVTEQKAAFIKKDDTWAKVFDAAAKARGEWTKVVGGNTKLLELVLAMDSAALGHSRKLLEGCEAKTSEALATAVSTIPAKSFAGWHDDREMVKPGFAQSAGPLLVNTPVVNLAAVAYAECFGKKSPRADYLSNYLQNVPGARGPRNYALGVLMGATFTFDDTNNKGMEYPQWGGRPYGRSGGAIGSSGGVVKSVKKDATSLLVILEKTSVKQDDCVKEHRSNHMARISNEGKIEYELICDKWSTVTHDTTWTDFHVNVADEKLLKPGVMFSTVFVDAVGDVVATWPNKTAKMPSMVLGGVVK